MKPPSQFATIDRVEACWRWGLVAPLLVLAALALGACADDGDAQPCNDHNECQLVADCCRCEAFQVQETLPECQLTCSVNRCFEEHGQANVVPRCVDNRCEVATTN